MNVLRIINEPTAAATATVAEPSVPIATEAKTTQSGSSSWVSSAPPPAVTEPEVEMTDLVADRKRTHSAVDLSSPATADEPMTAEDKRQRLQEEIAMIVAECQKRDTYTY